MYLEIDEHFPTHTKTMKLSARLQNGGAPFYLIKLWSWACGNAKDGNLSDLQPEDIEFIVGWTMGKFYTACVEVGFLDEQRDETGKIVGIRIHNWMKRTGGGIVKMTAEATRKKNWRAHRDKVCGGQMSCELCRLERTRQPPSAGHDGDVQGLSAGRPADKPDQVKSSQDKASQDKAGGSDAPACVANPVPDPNPARPGPWDAERWRQKYERQWLTKYGGTAMGGGTPAARASGDLADRLNGLPAADRRAAEARAETMFAEFLAVETPEVTAARHPWAWFVARFDSLRVPALPATRAPPPRRGPPVPDYPNLDPRKAAPP